MELADTPDLGSGASRLGGSSPPSRILGPQSSTSEDVFYRSIRVFLIRFGLPPRFSAPCHLVSSPSKRALIFALFWGLVFGGACSTRPPSQATVRQGPTDSPDAGYEEETFQLAEFDPASVLYQERALFSRWRRSRQRSISSNIQELLAYSSWPDPTGSSGQDVELITPMGGAHPLVTRGSGAERRTLLDLNRWYPRGPQLAFDTLRISPRGEAVLFAFAPLHGAPRGLFLSAEPARAPRPALNEEVYDVRWAPDGSSALGTSRTGDEVTKLWHLSVSDSPSSRSLLEFKPGEAFVQLGGFTSSDISVLALRPWGSEVYLCPWNGKACRLAASVEEQIFDTRRIGSSLLLRSPSHVWSYDLNRGALAVVFKARRGERVFSVVPLSAGRYGVLTRSPLSYFWWLPRRTSNVKMDWGAQTLTTSPGELLVQPHGGGGTQVTALWRALSGEVRQIILPCCPEESAGEVRVTILRNGLYPVRSTFSEGDTTGFSILLPLRPPRGIVVYSYGVYGAPARQELRTAWQLLLDHDFAVALAHLPTDGFSHEAEDAAESKRRSIEWLTEQIARMKSEFGQVALWSQSGGAVIALQTAQRASSLLSALILESPLLDLRSEPEQTTAVQEAREWGNTPRDRESLSPLTIERSLPPTLLAVATADELIEPASVARWVARIRPSVDSREDLMLVLDDQATHSEFATRHAEATRLAQILAYLEDKFS